MRNIPPEFLFTRQARNHPLCRRHSKTLRREMLMMKIRDVLIGFVVSAVVAWTIVSCGSGGGGGGGGGAPLSLAAQVDADLRSATLSGANETPAVTTAATGKGGVAVNRNSK